ncbi:MAG: transposase family protein, partial [Chthonomonadaceae bacterium]|nr:transposase family protein [Chthonomonadaceae bacterium]
LTFVAYYAKRWRIERFHYVLKSGCELEKLQLDTFTTLQKALSLYSIVAWRLLHLTYLAREQPDLPCEEAISATERVVLERATGRSITTVAEAVLAVARIAGFRPVPSAPTPGVKSLWLGFRKLYDMVAGFQLARQSPFQT